MALKTTFSPFFTTGKPGGSDILDRNLLAIKLTLDGLTTVVNETTLIVNPPAGSIADAQFWLSQASALLPNGVDLGALGTGVLQQTVAGGVATPQALPLVAGEVLYGGTASLIAQSPDLYFDPVNVRLGIGTNAPDVTLVMQRDIDGPAGYHITNASAGTNASSGWTIQAATSDVVATPPFLTCAQFGRNYVPPVPGDTPYFGPYVAALSYKGAGNVVFDADFDAGKGWLWTTRDGVGVQMPRMSLDDDGHLAVNDLIGGGLDHLVYAIDASGRLAKVTIGANLTFSGGTLAATGGGAGTVTAVTASSPLSSSGGTTPNITHDNSALGSGAHGSTGIASFTTDAQGHVTAFTGANYQAAGNYITALTGDGTAAGPGSAALTLATVNSNVGSFTYGSFTVNAKGLITAASSGATPQAPITWPAATRVLVSSGTTTDPVGYSTFVYVTADNHMRNDGPITINATVNAIGAGYLWTAQATAARDRAWWALAGVTVSDGVNREWFTINPAATTVDTNNLTLLATLRVRAPDYTLTGVAAGTIASVYADQPTFNGGNVSNPSNSAWVYYAGGGTTSQSKFEGAIVSNSISTGIGQFAGDGSDVFNLPTDNTGNTSAAVGRVPVLIAGITKYLRYYND